MADDMRATVRNIVLAAKIISRVSAPRDRARVSRGSVAKIFSASSHLGRLIEPLASQDDAVGLFTGLYDLLFGAISVFDVMAEAVADIDNDAMGIKQGKPSEKSAAIVRIVLASAGRGGFIKRAVGEFTTSTEALRALVGRQPPLAPGPGETGEPSVENALGKLVGALMQQAVLAAALPSVKPNGIVAAVDVAAVELADALVAWLVEASKPTRPADSGETGTKRLRGKDGEDGEQSVEPRRPAEEAPGDDQSAEDSDAPADGSRTRVRSKLRHAWERRNVARVVAGEPTGKPMGTTGPMAVTLYFERTAKWTDEDRRNLSAIGAMVDLQKFAGESIRFVRTATAMFGIGKWKHWLPMARSGFAYGTQSCEWFSEQTTADDWSDDEYELLDSMYNRFSYTQLMYEALSAVFDSRILEPYMELAEEIRASARGFVPRFDETTRSPYAALERVIPADDGDSGALMHERFALISSSERIKKLFGQPWSFGRVALDRDGRPMVDELTNAVELYCTRLAIVVATGIRGRWAEYAKKSSDELVSRFVRVARMSGAQSKPARTVSEAVRRLDGVLYK